MIKHKLSSERGQVALVFVASMVIVIAALALLIDGGRWLTMRSRARMLADASAYSGATVVDLERAGEGNIVLSDKYFTAEQVAIKAFNANKDSTPEYMDFDAPDITVRGNEIQVTVTGRSRALFGSQWGLNYSATVTSSARAGWGISTEN
ncbi:MAG: Tad domain-containing protein [Anaerolineales bacterium]|nr:Tad domain-containing protein [Anaerolineales bacterium]